MNETLGIAIAMLLKGMGVGDVMRYLAGAGQGASTTDGLGDVAYRNFYAANDKYPNGPSADTVSNAAESLLKRLGMDPYSEGGQGMASLLGSARYAFPGIMGAALGVPDGSKFFSMISNGAGAVGAAARHGTQNPLNRGSVIREHEFVGNLARRAYGLGVREKGGYDVGYTHGLNADEMGIVSQRLMSSDLPYADGKGGRIDFGQDKEAYEKFENNMKKLGGEFNKTASMLAKVTGSVEEAVRVMDDIAGGNFLGGTEDTAKKVAGEARNMAAAIRLTSAASGEDPKEAYRNIRGTKSFISGSLGLSELTARSTGSDAFASDMAYNAELSYGMWAAQNRNASPAQREAARYSAHARAASYAGSKGADIAAAVAANRGLFTNAEFGEIRDAFASGNPEAVVGKVRAKLGDAAFEMYTTDPAAKMYARQRAVSENRDSFRELNNAGMEGTLAQAAKHGARRELAVSLAAMGGRMSKSGGAFDVAEETDKSVKDKFVEILGVEGGFDKEKLQATDIADLRKMMYARKDADEVDRIENTARIEAVRKKLDGMTMPWIESELQQKLKEEINRRFTGKASARLQAQVDRGEYDEAYSSLAFQTGESEEELRKKYQNGNLTAAQARKEIKELDRLAEANRVGYTSEERMARMKSDIAREGVMKVNPVRQLVYAEQKDGTNTAARIMEFKKGVSELRNKGAIAEVDQENGKKYSLEAYEREAYREIAAGVLGKDLAGKVAGTIGEKMRNLVGRGKNVKQAFVEAVKDEDIVGVLEEKQQEQLAKIAGSASTANSTVSGQLSDNEFMSHFAARVEKNMVDRGVAVSKMDDIVKKGDGITAEDFETFKKLAGDVYGKAKVAEAAEGLKGGKAGVDELLEKLVPKGTRAYGTSAMLAGGSAEMAATISGAAKANVGMLPGVKLENLNDAAEYVAKMDSLKAERSMNALSNAVNFGDSGSFESKAVEKTKKDLESLSRGLEQMAGEDATNEFAKKVMENDKDAVDKFQKTFGNDAKYMASLLKASGDTKVGGGTVLEKALGGKLGELKSDEDKSKLLDVSRSAYRQGDVYQVLHEIGGFLSKIVAFLNAPQKFMSQLGAVQVKA